MHGDLGSLFFLQALSSALIFQNPIDRQSKQQQIKKRSRVEDSNGGEHADGEQDKEAVDCFSSCTFDHAVISLNMKLMKKIEQRSPARHKSPAQRESTFAEHGG